MNANSLAISKLTFAGWDVYIPTTNSNVIVISKDLDDIPSYCYILKAMDDGSNCPIGRVPKTGLSLDVDYLTFADVNSKKVWLVPRTDIKSFGCIRLGKRYECYEVGKPKTITMKLSDDAVKRAASAALKRALEEKGFRDEESSKESKTIHVGEETESRVDSKTVAG